MFSKNKLAWLLKIYKEYFNKNFESPSHGKIINHFGYKGKNEADSWPGESYKWMAFQCFQNNWDIDAQDFPKMLDDSLKLAKRSMLNSTHSYPCTELIKLANAKPEQVRYLFKNLYNEQISTYKRHKDFSKKTLQLAKAIGLTFGRQDHHAMSIYLSFRYPRKYFIYSHGQMLMLMKYLGYIIEPFGGMTNPESYQRFYNFYNEVRLELKKDKELPEILKENLTSNMYPDPELTLTTYDLGDFVRIYSDLIKEIQE